ncbi:MAG: hypothetical protein RI947_1067 [Candidatus Parcubacteria bacterium]|jgi:Rrf2 family protein
MFAINNKTDYGLLLISQLRERTEYTSLSRLVQETKLPQRFIARIAAELVKAGILVSREGKVGGYKIVKDLHDISLMDYLEYFEDKLEMVKCTDEGYDCKFAGICQHGASFKTKLNSIVRTELSKWTLADFMNKTQK